MTAALKIASESLPVQVAPPPPRGVQWLEVDEAAARMGVSEQRIRQRCATEWLAAGFASQRKPEGGGKVRWYVRHDADPRLGRCIAPADRPFEWGKYTDAQRAELRWKRDVLLEWEEVKLAARGKGRSEDAATDEYLERLYIDQRRVLGRETLYGWARKFQARGWAGLVDGRWKTGEDKAEADDDPFLELLRHYYLNPCKRSKQRCYELAADVAQERGWSVPSARTGRRYLDTIPTKTLILFREGAKAYSDQASPYIERDYTTIDSNAVWVGDHHRLDVMIDVGGGKHVRPWLTGWTDLRSRTLVGWMIYDHDPNQDTILATFRQACLAYGVPNGVYIDNGKDYDSQALQGQTKRQRFSRRRKGEARPQVDEGVFGELSIDVHHALPYQPRSKPIERFFGTLCSRFSRLIETYCGNSPGDRPENLQAKLAKGKAPTLAELQESFKDWLDGDYHARPHTGQGMDGRTPLQCFNACLKQKRTTTEETLNHATLKKTRPAKVGPNGVIYKGLRYGWDNLSLAKFFRKDVVLRVDDRDLSKVYVYEPGGRFICIAKANEKLPVMGATEQHLRKATASIKRDKKVAREYVQVRPRLADDIPERLRRRAAEEKARQQRPDPNAPPPPSLVPVQTPVADQMPLLKKAMEREQLRPAVGAESVSFVDALKFMTERRDAEESAAPPQESWRELMRVFSPREDAEDSSAT